MKKIWLGAAFGLAVLLAPNVLAAESQTEKTSEAEAENAEITVKAGDTVVTLQNETGSKDISADIKADAGKKTDDTAVSYTVTLSDEDGSHIFENVDFSGWTSAALTEDQGFWYLQYSDGDGNTKELSETADEKEPADPLTMWALTDVYVREAPDPEAAATAVASLGDEVTVTSILPGWFQVEYGDITGYINHKYLTAEESEAQAAKEAEETAQAAAAAQSSSSYDYSYTYTGTGNTSASSSAGSTSSAQEECLENGLLN